MRLHNRQIKASFWNDPDLLAWHRDKRLFYEGLTQLADDSGCLEDSAFAFKLELFRSPMDADVTVEVIQQWRDELVEQHKLIAYRAQGKQCLYMMNFHKHQTLKNPDRPEVPLPDWIEWRPYPSNSKAGKYVFSDVLLTKFLGSSYKSLTPFFQPEGEPEPEDQPEREREERGDRSVPSADQEVAAAGEKASSSSLSLKDVVKAYESEGFGQMTHIVSQQLIELADEFTPVWVIEAFSEAVIQNKRRLSLVRGILQNWRAEGGIRRSNVTPIPARKTTRAGPNEKQRDERYAAFYQLFPDS